MHEAAAAWHAHAVRACVHGGMHGGSRIDPDANGRKKRSNVSKMEVRKHHLLVGVGGRSLRHCA